MSERQWFYPRGIITGLTVDYKRDRTAVVGAYVEASIGAEITNKRMNADKVAYIWGRLETVKVRWNAS